MTKQIEDAKEELYYRWILGRPAVNGFMDGGERRNKFMCDLDALVALALKTSEERKHNDSRV
jgi:hypothetical protein